MAKKILIIEDDQYTRDIYEEVLKEAGYEVDTAFDGEQGLHKALAGGYDLILLDVMMPKLDGIGVLKALKAEAPKSKNGKIILLTNLGHEQVVDEAKSLGAASYLVKSALNPDQLLEQVKKFLT